MKTTNQLPPRQECLRAMAARDRSYEGIFIIAVRTTGILCRPGCPARTPLERNVEFFATIRDGLFAGYRPCKRCRPLEPEGLPPQWLRPLLVEVEADPSRRLRDADLRGLGIDPARVRRWFQAQHGMSFHAYQRARRMGLALGQIRQGDGVLNVAGSNGFESASGFAEAFARMVGRPPAKGKDLVPVAVTRILTPLGPMVAAASDEGLCLLEFADRRMLETQLKRLATRLSGVFAPGSHPHLDSIEKELDAYFSGALTQFRTPLNDVGTPFQQAVWHALRRIDYASTVTYAQLAARIARPSAVRAVGRANGDNRFAIVIPCHRVLGSDGQLTGYGGGVWRKRWLLDHERQYVQGPSTPSLG